MSVRKEASGRRWIQVEVEVPGTPEEVWQAIATGPGISSWFVPSEVEERVGGSAVSHFGTDASMDSVGTVTAWEPPHRYVVETDESTPDTPGPGPVASEWTVEARSGGTCVVRVVHAWFASADDWDAQFEAHEGGWAGFFKILRLVLTHFRGQPCAAFQLMGFAREPADDAWAALTGALGIGEMQTGGRVQSSSDAPALAGVVEEFGPPEWPSLLLRTDRPAPGLVNLFAMPMGGQVLLPVRVFFYGDDAAEVVAREEPIWQGWMAERFAPSDVGAA